MTTTENVLVYATGSDTVLRGACFELFAAGVTADVDLLDQTRLYVRADGAHKVGASGRGVAIVTTRANAGRVLDRLRQARREDPDIQAYVLPILEQL